MTMEIRNASSADLTRINDIYNYYVKNSTCTFQIDEETMASRIKWFENRDDHYPVTVAVEKNRILGWGAISRFKAREAYANTGEISVYVDASVHRQGIGEKLLTDLLKRSGALNFHTLISIIAADQVPSIKLHEKHKFKTVAELKEVGYKFGQWLDVVYMQYMVQY